MPRRRRTRHSGRTWVSSVGADAKPLRLAVRVALRRDDQPDEAELPGSDPRQVRLSRLLRTFDAPPVYEPGIAP